MLTRLAACAAALLLVPALAACGSSSSTANSQPSGTACSYPTDPQGAAKKVNPPPSVSTVSGSVPATLVTTIGTWKATLDATQAPCTVNSFVSLAKQGYFDHTPCHRLTTAPSGIYVLQCGDPTGTGTGGPGYTIPDELSGKETYGPGTLAMANTGAPNSGGSQFFVVYKKTGLPPHYTVFGHLTAAALQTVQKTAAKGTDNAFGVGDGHPKVKVDLLRVTTG